MTIYQQVSDDPQPGDRATIEFTFPDWPIAIEPQYEDIEESIYPITVTPRKTTGILLDGVTEMAIRFERPVEVPTKPGAVLWPDNPDALDPLFLDSTEIWVDGDGVQYETSFVAVRLASGDYRVAFGGVDQ